MTLTTWMHTTSTVTLNSNGNMAEIIFIVVSVGVLLAAMIVRSYHR